MINALEGFTPEWYTPKGQAEDTQQTSFQVRPLDGEQLTNLQLMLDGNKFTGESVTYALSVGLVDWKNFKGASGDVPFTLINQRKIPMVNRIDIASKIFDISILSEGQLKNS